MDNYCFFCSAIQNKAHETFESFSILYEKGKYMTCVSLLRIQLDCYVRLLFLNAQSDTLRECLLEDFYRGERWRISDHDMLKSVSRYGWEHNVYKLSCSFIHLSRLSNIDSVNILNTLNKDDSESIVGFINNYHGASLTVHSTNQEIIKYLPDIMQKITDNLLYELNTNGSSTEVPHD